MCRPAAVLHGHLIALARSARSFARALVATPFQLVPLLPRPRNKVLLALAVLRQATKNNSQDEVTRLFPVRRRSVSLLPRRLIRPPCRCS